MKVLDGVTVLDFTQAHSGPFCTMNLADFGARVIKIERSGSGDQSRAWTPFKNGKSGYFASINRNKESMTLNIATKEGADIVKRMVKDADIIVENFKSGTMDKFGLSYNELKKINPAIIYASISGFGQEGPLQKRPAYDNIIQSMTGILDMTGFSDGVFNDSPTRVGPPIADNFTGLTMDVAICMAYFNRLNTGKGQYVDVAMLDTMFEIMERPVLFYDLLGEKLSRTGNSEPESHAPYDVFVCEDGYFSVGIENEEEWETFCNVVEMPELINEPRFINNKKRCENHDLLFEILQKNFFIHSNREILSKIFTEAGIPNAPVLSIPELRNHPQIAAREMLIDIDDPSVGEYKAIANPIKMDRTPAQLKSAAPLLGQDTEKILHSFGYSQQEIEMFRENEII